MRYRERLAERIRSYFTRRGVVEEKRMFGGLCFILNGHMCCRIDKDRPMLRVLANCCEILIKQTADLRNGFYGETTERISV